MSVYVDDLKDYEKVIRGNGPYWCHLMADTSSELHQFADRLGLKRSYAQHLGRATEHYDLTAGKRKQAIAFGAIESTFRDMLRRNER